MSKRTVRGIPEYISNCLQCAILLEVSAYPKAGNVHRTADFGVTRYEHFLASAIAVGTSFRVAAKKGVLVARQKLGSNQIAVGKMIRDAVGDVASWQNGGNTLLGSIILLMPIAVSAGITFSQGDYSILQMRRNLDRVIKTTTPEDAVNLYDAVKIARPGGLGQAPKLDVANVSSRQRIQDEKVSLYEVFKISASWDSISSEWVNNFHITFNIGYPFLFKQLKINRDVNAATVNTFIRILSQVPDTLIARKAGLDKAKEVTIEAQHVFEAGGLATPEGRKLLHNFDKKLRDPAHKLNPGTTADITSAVLALALLEGYRP